MKDTSEEPKKKLWKQALNIISWVLPASLFIAGLLWILFRDTGG